MQNYTKILSVQKRKLFTAPVSHVKVKQFRSGYLCKMTFKRYKHFLGLAQWLLCQMWPDRKSNPIHESKQFYER